MKRIAFLILCLGCGFAGFLAKTAVETEAIAAFLSTYGPWIAVAGLGMLVTIGLALLGAYLYLRHRMRKLLGAEGRMSEAEIAAGLVDLVTTPQGITNPTPEDRQRAALVNAGAWLMRRQSMQFYFNVMVTVVGGLIGTATLFLLYEQNQKLEAQNTRIALQTDANIAQSILLEGTRRAALPSDMLRIIDDIRTEAATNAPPCGSSLFSNCTEADPVTGGRFHNLSEDLLPRVQAFAQNNAPYQVAIFNSSDINFDIALRAQLNLKNLSPERGQLTHALVQSAVVPREMNLSYAQLGGAQFQQATLFYARLSYADMEGINLYGANLINTTLIGANMQGAELNGTVLTSARLEGANLTRANLMNANLDSADLRGAILDGAHISGAKFRNAFITGMSVKDTWAWSDRLPEDLPDGIKITTCTFGTGGRIQFREVRPDDC